MEEIENAGSDAAQLDAVAETEVTDTQAPEGEVEETKEKTGNPKIDDPWPKSARNALTRRDRQIGQLRAELNELRKSQQAAQPKPEAPKEPKEGDFDNYGDYLKALAQHRPQQQEQPDIAKLQEQARQEAMQQHHYDTRVEQVSQQALKAVQEVPELQTMLQEFSDVLDTFPPAIEMAFLEADNAPMAFYALAKEGRLEQLAHMNPYQAAMVIAQAQVRGEQMAKASKVSKAPQPIRGARGSAPGSRSVENMSADDLLKSIRG